MKSHQPVTLNSRLGLFSKAKIGLEWLLFGTGLGATNHFESCGFIRSRAGVEYPDIQYHFPPAAMRYERPRRLFRPRFPGPCRADALKSRGHVRIKAPDPKVNPTIFFNYMSHADDWKEFRACIRLTRELFQQEAMQPFAGEEIQPGSGVQSDAQIDAFIRQHCESAYHPCGTNRMGSPKDKMAVVDPQCRVIGIESLRVVDSSIMPQVTNGNLNGPTIMIGEKASDHILGKTPCHPRTSSRGSIRSGRRASAEAPGFHFSSN